MHILTCGIKLNSFKICMQKNVNVTYTTISLGRIFGSRYQHQVLDFLSLRWFGYSSLIGLLRWMNREIQLVILPFTKTKFLWRIFNFLVSTLYYIIVLRWMFKFTTIRIIVDKVWKNICPLCSTYSYVNQRKKSKCRKQIIKMVTKF